MRARVLGAVSVVAALLVDPELATGGDIELPAWSGRALPSARGDLFSASGECASCHTGLVGDDGEPISPDTTWRAGVMANSARDPWWRAAVRAEITRLPALRHVIEDRCATCHAPMARAEDRADRTDIALLDDGYLAKGHKAHKLAIDGVSCTLCHQILPDQLGEPTTFSGGFVLDEERPRGERQVHGLSEVDPIPAGMMRAVSGFTPVRAPHLSSAGLCATCHTVYTPWVDAAGEISGTFPQQTTYLEWEASGWADSRSCRDCHMVEATFAGLDYPRHLFRGANSWMLRVLAAAASDLALPASSEELAAAIGPTTKQLEQHTVRLSIEKARVRGPALRAEVVVVAQTGHKFPTGFPSRRAWLHVTVRDRDGRVVFESGRPEDDGTIRGNDNDRDPTRFEPHHEVLSQPEQVQIYETILADSQGQVTTSLIAAAHYLKDNRLLPMGLTVPELHPDTVVRGGATEDPTFGGSGDRLKLTVHLLGAHGPFEVEAELLYQPAAPHWFAGLHSRREPTEEELMLAAQAGEPPLEATEGPEITEFLDLVAEVPAEPVVVARATVTAR